MEWYVFGTAGGPRLGGALGLTPGTPGLNIAVFGLIPCAPGRDTVDFGLVADFGRGFVIGLIPGARATGATGAFGVATGELGLSTGTVGLVSARFGTADTVRLGEATLND
mmetsp:Transcript_418/g.488  ORF Transcript_418/g.488 Transcript_418/m.488 type:complete len:110 (+) Transcript_418:440-769(+)